MDFACRGRPTAAAIGGVHDSYPHRFLDAPPPPPHGVGELAAARRREELLWELQKERIRQEMILHELAERDRAMAARFGHPGQWPLQALPPVQDFWRHRRPPSLPPWDQVAAARPPPAVPEHPPCFSWSPAAPVRLPPMYPHVERSPSPVPWPLPAHHDGDQQQKCRSPPGVVWARPMLSGDGDLPEGALMPDASNAGARTLVSASFAEKATPGEPKHGVEDGHGRCRNQSGVQRGTVESTVKDQANELVAGPCQDNPASQENGASDEQKRTAFTEPAPQAEGLKRKLTTLPTTSPVTTKKHKPHQEQKATPGNQRAAGGEVSKLDVEDGHGESGNKSNVQRGTVECTVKDQTNGLVAGLCQDKPASQKSGASDEQKRTSFRKAAPQAEGLEKKQTTTTTTTSPVTTKKQKNQKPLWTCDLCQVITYSRDALVAHWTGKRHGSNLKARKKPADNKATPGSATLRGKGTESLPQNGGGSGENAPRPTEDEDQEQPAPSRWTCLLCDAKCRSASSLQDHLRSSGHRAKTEAILGKFSNSYTRKEDGSAGKRNCYYCKLCDANCTGDTMLALHLVGRKHRRRET